MSFIEKTRNLGHEEGTEIVYSEAYEALTDFERALRQLENIKKELHDRERDADDAHARMEGSKKALISALFQHYDGDIPSAITTAFGIIVFEFGLTEIGIRFIESRSYADLYKIEKVGKEVSA